VSSEWNGCQDALRNARDLVEKRSVARVCAANVNWHTANFDAALERCEKLFPPTTPGRVREVMGMGSCVSNVLGLTQDTDSDENEEPNSDQNEDTNSDQNEDTNSDQNEDTNIDQNEDTNIISQNDDYPPTIVEK
jgi:hypothetical protein